MSTETLSKLPSSQSVIVLAGPTGVGKTGVAINLAQHYQTQIISADSRQCYQEMNIGVARPSPAQLKAVEHHFIASHSIHQKIDAAVFEEYAINKARVIFETSPVIIMTGGTGLYIKAFCDGLDAIPAATSELRKSILTQYQEKGMAWLQKEVAAKDAAYFNAGEIHNPQRLMRALETVLTTGQSILYFQTGKKRQRDFNVLKIALELPKEELYQNINNRVEQMLTAGLVEEVAQLVKYKDLNALQTVGYTEIFDFLDKKISIGEATELIQKNTRHYAKRQMTWFRKDKEINWFSPLDVQKLKGYLDRAVKF